MGGGLWMVSLTLATAVGSAKAAALTRQTMVVAVMALVVLARRLPLLLPKA